MYICLNDIQWIRILILHIEEEFCSDYIIRVYENDMLAQLFGVTTTVPVSKVSIHTYICVALYVYVYTYIHICILK